MAKTRHDTHENTHRSQVHDLRPAAARRVVEHAGDLHDATVVEPGAGTGALTGPLLEAGATVWAIERDPARAATLARLGAAQIADGRLRLIDADLSRRLPEPSVPWVVVGNPPFNLTATLVRRWLVSGPEAMTLVLQKEAADKLTGAPGSQTRSSVLARCAGAPHRALRLERGDTTPPARVDLAVWRWHRSADAPDPHTLLRLDALLDHAFAGPRSVREALKGVLSSEQVRRQGAERGFAPDAHPRTLQPMDWLSILRFVP